MVSLVREDGRADFHDYAGRIERALRHLNNHPDIGSENKERLLRYLEHLEDEGLSLARRVTQLVRLTLIAETLAKDFDSASREDLQRLIRRLKERMAKANGQSPARTLSERSLEDYQNTVKKFWRWLKAPPSGDVDGYWNPPETAWMKRIPLQNT
jgi:hypothetical protein